jgi:UDP-N-acetylglucosamine 2-epimerase (non-hydrolysing)
MIIKRQIKIDAEKIFVTENIVIDALMMAIDIIQSKWELQQKIVKDIEEKRYKLNREQAIYFSYGRSP